MKKKVERQKAALRFARKKMMRLTLSQPFFTKVFNCLSCSVKGEKVISKEDVSVVPAFLSPASLTSSDESWMTS